MDDILKLAKDYSKKRHLDLLPHSQMKKGFRLFFLVFSMLLVATISMEMLQLE